MEEKQKNAEVKEPVSKRKKALSIVLILAACAVAIGGSWYARDRTGGAEKKQAEEKIDTSQFNADSLVGWTEDLNNRYVLADNPEAIPMLSMVSTDTDVVKTVEPNLENVDINTPGEYEVSYDVTAYAKALKSAVDRDVRSVIHDGAKGQTCKITVNGKITVVDEETAKELKTAGKRVYGFRQTQ